MSKILPYPWQHSAYDEFDKVSDRVVFCLERADEAERCGLEGVKRAWISELVKHIPTLLDEKQK